MVTKKKATKKKSTKTSTKKTSAKTSSSEAKPDSVATSKNDDVTIKKSIVAVIIVLAVIAFAVYIFNSMGTVSGTTAATVGDTVITVAELDAEYDTLPDVYRQNFNKADYLERVMVLQVLLLNEASGVSDTEVDRLYADYLSANNLDETQAADLLAQQGVTLDRFKDMIRIQVYLNETLYNTISVSEEDKQNFYEENQANLLDEEGESLTYDDVEGQIEDFLAAQALQLETQKFIENLQENAEYEILYEG